MLAGRSDTSGPGCDHHLFWYRDYKDKETGLNWNCYLIWKLSETLVQPPSLSLIKLIMGYNKSLLSGSTAQSLCGGLYRSEESRLNISIRTRLCSFSGDTLLVWTTALRTVSEQGKRSTGGGLGPGLGVGHGRASSWPGSGGFYHCGKVCRSTRSVPALQQPHDSGMILQQVRALPPLPLFYSSFTL